MSSTTAGDDDVEPVEREPAVGQRARVGEVRERAGREVVDDVDAPVFGQQPVDERRTDESGAAGDEACIARRSRRATRGSAGRARPRSECRDGTVTPAPTIVSARERDVGLEHRVLARRPSRGRCCRATTRAPACSTAPSSVARRLRPPHRPRAPTRARAHRPRRGRRRRSAPAPRRARRARSCASPCTQTPGADSHAPGRGRKSDSGPPSTSACAWRYFSGVPMSSQYASLW